MNRDERAALGRAAITVLAGAAIVYALAQWIGWWTVGALGALAAAEQVWEWSRMPRHWRPW